MSELIELEKEATESLDGIELNNKTMQRPQGNNPMLNVDASAKVVVKRQQAGSKYIAYFHRSFPARI